jgi:mycothiol maleylpyruvate isomerase-like protein
MTSIRDDFLAAARAAAGLVREPAVAAAWGEPSALPKLGVSGLAGHLAHQVLAVPVVLATPTPGEPAVSLLEHYRRSEWIGADLDAGINVGIRNRGEETAAGGPVELAARVDSTIEELTGDLAAVADRPVRLAHWGPWSLTLDDFLVTRVLELAVHSDDLAVSVGVRTPELPAGAVHTVIDLLSRLSVDRHGPSSVLRAFSRAERAPATVAAF